MSYPETTWAGDPSAPWNVPTPADAGATCGMCAWAGPVTGSDVTACLFDAAARGERFACAVGHDDPACEYFEEREAGRW